MSSKLNQGAPLEPIPEAVAPAGFNPLEESVAIVDQAESSVGDAPKSKIGFDLSTTHAS